MRRDDAMYLSPALRLALSFGAAKLGGCRSWREPERDRVGAIIDCAALESSIGRSGASGEEEADFRKRRGFSIVRASLASARATRLGRTGLDNMIWLE